MELNLCPAEPEGPAVPGALQQGQLAQREVDSPGWILHPSRAWGDRKCRWVPEEKEWPAGGNETPGILADARARKQM